MSHYVIAKSKAPAPLGIDSVYVLVKSKAPLCRGTRQELNVVKLRKRLLDRMVQPERLISLT